MKSYIIHRQGDSSNDLGPVTVTMVDAPSGEFYALTPERSLQVANHSPTGFEFGYGGSGPAQLALAILLDFTDDRNIAQAHYQNFKWDFIAPMGHPGDTIMGETIQGWLLAQKNESVNA